ncbi:MAG: prepilin-type N-terminal cleavage/methylation domain-containing protein [Thermoguttaceae bacterium]|nr:prepilin-type N-terminal cleavage/methylation domain-containing protein [Thermoguttaceae bacterium]
MPNERRPGQTGFTLIELLIVMALLVLLVGVSLPALRRPLRKSELREAARELSATLGRTRLEAIESGTILQFRYRPGTGQFVVAPASSPIDDQPAAIEEPEFEAEDSTTLVEQSVARDDSAESKINRQQLPEGIRFADPTESLEPVDGDFGMPAGTAGLPVLAEDSAWSSAVIFYPNGKATSATFRLRGQEDYYVDVSLRGLTGAATIGEIQSLPKLDEEGLDVPSEPVQPTLTAAESPGEATP